MKRLVLFLAFTIVSSSIAAFVSEATGLKIHGTFFAKASYLFIQQAIGVGVFYIIVLYREKK